MRSLDIKSDLLHKDFLNTYSSVVDAITLRYLISLNVCEKLDIHLMDSPSPIVENSIFSDWVFDVCQSIFHNFDFW